MELVNIGACFGECVFQVPLIDDFVAIQYLYSADGK